MSNVVDFLQRAGEDSQLRYASLSGLKQALSQTGIAPPLREALLNGDSAGLAVLLASRTEMCGVIYAPQDEEPDEDQEPHDEKEYTS